ncbi:LCP family protein [Pseudonocardia sp.]|uniref:LCP family protein n=1 Tax=Pseudonocardia sp. TaxID=60912 RepID=UPI003D09F836
MHWIDPPRAPFPETDASAERAAVGRPASRRPRARVVALAALAVVVLLAGVGFLVVDRLGDNVDRLPDVFAPLDPAARPADEPGLTFLLMGTDSRAALPTTGSAAGADEGSARSDVVMLARLAPDASSAAVVSIPRDSWVDIPGRGPAKINAAYAYGGPSLLVRTAEQLTGIRVDHFAVVDFAGFQAMVDAVGGIDVQVAAPTSNYGVDFHAGMNHLDGAEALAYVRQRYDLPEGDLDRARRQQNALRALLTKVASAGTLADPVALYGFLDAATHSVGVDDSMTNGRLRELALDARGLRPAGVTFLSAPVRGLGREGDQSVVYLDGPGGALLWAAVRSGTVAEYVAANPAAELGEEPS